MSLATRTGSDDPQSTLVAVAGLEPTISSLWGW
jgi:hypothetical protein